MVQSSKSEAKWLWHKLSVESSDPSAFPLPSLLPFATRGEAALLFALPPCRLEVTKELQQLQSGGHFLSCWPCFKPGFFEQRVFSAPESPAMQVQLTYCECLIWKNHNQNLLGSLFFADEWAEAGDVLAWPLSSSHSHAAMA